MKIQLMTFCKVATCVLGYEALHFGLHIFYATIFQSFTYLNARICLAAC